MKRIKKAVALALSVILAAGLSSCESDPVASGTELIDEIIDDVIDEPTAETSVTGETLPVDADTEEPVSETTLISETETETEAETEASADEQEETYDDLIQFLPEDELQNKTVKWLSYYDPWDEESMPFHKSAAKLFEEKYDGEIDVRYTTLETHFSDLSVMIIGGEGIDLFPGIEPITRSFGDPMFISYDEYVDWKSPIWSSVRSFNDPYVLGGKHYFMACYLEEEYVVFYNKNTIQDNGYPDPWTLYKNGEWTASRFMSMLEDFVDPDNERYGLDGWFNVRPLSSVGGLPAVSFKNGRVVSNLSAPAFERSMNYQYELYQKGLVFDKSDFDYASQEKFISEGKELFYIAPTEAYSLSWDLDDIGIVPVPKDDKADRYYHNARIDSYYLCRRGENPEGAVRLIECLIASYNDEGTRMKSDDHYRANGWTDDMLERRDEIRRLAQKNPVVDISGVLSSEAYSVMTDMIYMPLEGTDWASAREASGEQFASLIGKINAEIDAAAN